MSAERAVALEARNLSKSFPGVKALQDVSLTLRHGQLTAMLGENGAGKSTLMNILAGVFPPDTGEILISGVPVRFQSPRQAQERGIAMIFQELSLVPGLTVAENLFLGREPLSSSGMIDYGVLNRNASLLLQRLDLDIPPSMPVGRLRVGQQQLVEIARALAREVRILIMDEPTSAITDRETAALFARIADLKRQGVAIAYITHKMDELPRICDDVAIMRDGQMVTAAAFSDLTHDDMVRLMVGREVSPRTARRTRTKGKEILRVENLALKHPERPGDFLVDRVSFTAFQGEILGIFGLIGSGRTELMECLYGLHPATSTGELYLEGSSAKVRSPGEAIKRGIALAPEDRKREGLILTMSVGENASLASLRRAVRFGLIHPSQERECIEAALARLRVKMPSLRQPIRDLSGGNQQKVILGKWLATQPKILLLDEPTRGIDVHAKQEIYALLQELTDAGLTIIVVSSELPEILMIADRILVLCEGCLTATFSQEEATEEQLLHAALSRKTGSS